MPTISDFQRILKQSGPWRLDRLHPDEKKVVGNVLELIAPEWDGAVENLTARHGEWRLNGCQPPVPLAKIISLVDAACRRFGHDAAVRDVFGSFRQDSPEGDGAGDGDDDGDGDGEGNAAAENVTAAETQLATAQDAVAEAKKALENFPETPFSKSPSAERIRDDLVKALQQARRLRRRAKKQLHNAKQQLPGDWAPVSFEARKSVGRGLAALKRVPLPLQIRMAALINKIINAGAYGADLDEIPLTCNSKLVRRMLVKKPLVNAYKSDDHRGRPAIAFLPDVSPSCAASARAACDVANAAGYAGVSGTDVVVLPHFNGCVTNGDEYVPWVNGRPHGNLRKNGDFFSDVCRGRAYNVKVFVIVGDHDGEELYKEIASNQRNRLIWLHNGVFRLKGSKRLTSPLSRRNWLSKAKNVAIVSDCRDEASMLAGFSLAAR